MREIFNSIWYGKLFTVAECRDLRKQLAAAPLFRGAPNSMNKYGAVIIGPWGRQFVRRLQQEHIEPIAHRVHHAYVAAMQPARAASAPRFQKQPYAFTIEYAHGKQRSLARHADSSDWTLNVCLGALRFYGDFAKHGKSVTIAQRTGYVVVHRGDLEHRALPLQSGSRTNLVIWARLRAGKR